MQRNRNRNKSKSGTTQNSGNQNRKKSGNSGRSYRNNRYGNKTNDFKFQLHEGGGKKAYTFEKLREAVILRIQTDFQAARYVVSSLRKGIKEGPPAPERETSTKTDMSQKAIEQETMNRKYEAKLVHYFTQEQTFEDNWIKAYGLICRLLLKPDADSIERTGEL